MELFSRVVFLWISMTIYVDCGLGQTQENVNKFGSILAVSVDPKAQDIQEIGSIVFKRPRRPTKKIRKPVQPRPILTTTTPSPTTTTPAPPQRKGAVKRTFKIKRTFIKRFYPKGVFWPNYFKYIKSFRWEDFQRRQKNNRCPWC